MKKLLTPINYQDSLQFAKGSFSFFCKNSSLNVIAFLFFGLLVGFFYLAFTQNLLLIIIGYFVSIFAIHFLLAWMVAISVARLKEKKMSLVDGLLIAQQNAKNIFFSGLFFAFFGFLSLPINTMQHILEKIQIKKKWNYKNACYFVLPIMVNENKNLFQAMAKSHHMIGNGWKNTLSIKNVALLLLLPILFICNEFIVPFHNALYYTWSFILPVCLIIYILSIFLELIAISVLYLNHHRHFIVTKQFDQSIINRAFIKDND